LNINKKIDDEQFKKELQKNNINISGVSDYCYNNLDEFKHKFIINYSAVSEKNLKKALDVMNEALSE
jgi:GntR family transcriptional regulator/MocR family aminotransferase